MENGNLENRIAILENRVNELEQKLMAVTPAKSWRELAGKFAGDEVMRQIAEEAQKYREADRKKAQKGKGRP